MQAKALIPMSGLVVMLVARLNADRALPLSSTPSSVNPAVLLSTKKEVVSYTLILVAATQFRIISYIARE